MFDSSSSTPVGLGGFLPFELPTVAVDRRVMVPEGAWLVNTGRNALRLIARSMGATSAHLPMLGCDVLADALTAEGLDVSRYRIGRDLLPVDLPPECDNAMVVLTDIYGMVGNEVRALAERRSDAVLDLTHAVLATAPSDIPWFASYRKMLGLADGAVAHVPGRARPCLDVDCSSHRYLPRLSRLDVGPELARAAYLSIEADLDGVPPRIMSPLTERLLHSVDAVSVAAARTRNFDILDHLLAAAGIARLPGSPGAAPFCWPLVTPTADCHPRFHDAGVYAPRLWPEVVERAGNGSPEGWIVEHCVPIPVDHQLDEADMNDLAERIIDVMGRVR